MEYYATVEELLLLYRVGGTTTETSTIATTGGGEHPTIILQERATASKIPCTVGATRPSLAWVRFPHCETTTATDAHAP